jgi:hypothetical protein
MENTIIVLKRSNGMYGIYVNGNRQEHLQSNASQTERASTLIDRILFESSKFENVNIVFTDKEKPFESGLPDLLSYINKM